MCKPNREKREREGATDKEKLTNFLNFHKLCVNQAENRLSRLEKAINIEKSALTQIV